MRGYSALGQKRRVRNRRQLRPRGHDLPQRPALHWTLGRTCSLRSRRHQHRFPVKLGADASAAARPEGRTAETATDVVMKAEVLSYSRSKGLFAGVSLEGSTLRSDG